MDRSTKDGIVVGIVCAAIAGLIAFGVGTSRGEDRMKDQLTAEFDEEIAMYRTAVDQRERAWLNCLKVISDSEDVVFAQFEFTSNVYDDMSNYVVQAFHLGQANDIEEATQGLGRSIAYRKELHQATRPSSIYDWANDDQVDRCRNFDPSVLIQSPRYPESS